MYMMWQLASLPFCCCSREKCTVNTHLSTGISIPLIKAFNTPSHLPKPKKPISKLEKFAVRKPEIGLTSY